MSTEAAQAAQQAERQSSTSACQLPYPDRFHAATTFVSRVPEATFNDETRLLFYALHKQAAEGPCKDTKPWSWNVVESAKWQSWSQLGSMPAMEAMRLYVRTLDEEQPEWWTRLPEAPEPGAPGEAAAPGAAGDAGLSISSVFQEGTWVVIQQDDAKKPIPRYEQGAALMGPNLYVMGGHYSGRYLQDMWAYNLNKLMWNVAVPPEREAAEGSGQGERAALLAPSGPPAAAGWSVTPLQDNKLLVMGGHSKLLRKLKKGEKLPPMPVWVVDLDTATWTPLATTGAVPCARGGHSACPLPDDRIVVYGGEDSHRRPLSDVHVLDLTDFTWSQLAISGKQQPAARSGHSATLHHSSLVVFGGGSLANCFNDLWSLDLTSGAWSRPDVSGTLPTPRAGHGSVLVGDSWYVLGGGNNIKGCTEMLVADLSELPANRVSWSRVCSVPAGSPLSSEGISLMHSPELNLLVAFGGYNGKYHNAVSVYKLPGGSSAAASPQADSQRSQPAAADGQQQQAPPQQQQQQEQQQQRPGRQPEQQLQQQQPQPVQPSQQGAAANGPPLPNGTPASAHEQNLLKELALSREQLKRDLAAAKQELELVAGAAEAAKEEAAAEVQLLRQQLTAAQQQAAAAEKAAEDARAALSAEQAKTLKLEATLAEAQDRLNSVTELERELARYRKKEEAEASKKGSGGLWAYMAGGN